MLPAVNSLFRKLVLSGCFLLAFFALMPAAIAQDTLRKASASPKKIFYGQASFYAGKFHGRKTASGEIFNKEKMTCACNVVRLGTWLRVTNLGNGKSVVVKVNDRIHPRMRRLVDLSSAAARKLGYTKNGLARVKVEVLGRKKPA
jgi:rare lipoprotein A